MSKKLNRVLGINDEPEESKDLVPVASKQFQAEDTVEEDLELAKTHIESARDVAQMAVQDMIDIAKQSQHPKAYETLNSLVKTYAEIAKDTITIHEKRQRLTGKQDRENDGSKTVTNNNLIMTTDEVLKLLKGEE